MRHVEENGRDIGAEIAALQKTLRILRGENGCPWDRERSMDDIISDLINEAYELLRAEKSKHWDSVEEELGDVMFLAIFVHELYSEHSRTPLSEIVSRVHRKIVGRHPHVFGSTTAHDSAGSMAEWERIKKSEKKHRPVGCLDDVPPELPPLRKAAAIQNKAAGVGFDWPDRGGIFEKLREEIGELELAVERGDRSMIKDEVGDCIFTIVNLARRLQVEPENALEQTTEKFISRFRAMEKSARSRGVSLDNLSLEELERLWQESKKTI
ncbi:MAG TPA: nucleoside triphosphate pyrophosphohydrolase [Patescibacteria group bacterium]|nr:nucleoside triphosphate pyrophosphohydrolase [Patescibacteria group bacterium]